MEVLVEKKCFVQSGVSNWPVVYNVKVIHFDKHWLLISHLKQKGTQLPKLDTTNFHPTCSVQKAYYMYLQYVHTLVLYMVIINYVHIPEARQSRDTELFWSTTISNWRPCIFRHVNLIPMT